MKTPIHPFFIFNSENDLTTQGHANPGFLASLSSGSLKQWAREPSLPPMSKMSTMPPMSTAAAPIPDPDTDIDSDSFLSDLEVMQEISPCIENNLVILSENTQPTVIFVIINNHIAKSSLFQLRLVLQEKQAAKTDVVSKT